MMGKNDCKHESVNYIASHKMFYCNSCGKKWKRISCKPIEPLPSDLKDLEEILNSNPAINKGAVWCDIIGPYHQDILEYEVKNFIILKINIGFHNTEYSGWE